MWKIAIKVNAKNLVFVFVVAFMLNFVWEYFHSALYVFYKGAPIILPVLLRAALFDAAVIALLYFIFSKHKNTWLAVCVALLFAIALELFALKTGRWEYKNIMPLIPFLNVGLTPVVQLPLLYWLTIKVTRLWKIEKLI